MKTTGVIGTGAMGGGIVVNLLARGYVVDIRDIIAEREAPLLARGARRQPHPAAVITQADVTLVVVETADQIDAVLQGPHGLLAALAGHDHGGKVVMLCSTIAPDDTERFAGALREVGARVVDAPVSGGPARAADGSMSIMLAAESALLEDIAPLLADLAANRFVVSDRPGDSARAKLANNLAAGVFLAASSEAMSLAVSLGLDPDVMCRLMAASSGQSWIGDDRLPRALQGLMPTVGAATRVLTKDLTLAVQAASAVDAATPLADAALARFRQACAAGMGENDDSALYTLYRLEGTPRS